jgi:hypothetical protein
VTTVTVAGAPSPYQYVAHYGGDQLISADLVEDGEVVSSNTNFQFDSNGNVVAYDYVYHPGGYAQTYTLGYDDEGNLTRLYDGTIVTYNRKGNAVQIGDSGFTYHSRTNPLGSYDDLWLVFVEEPFIAEYFLSNHVVSKEVRPDGTVVTYTNEYDKDRRLIRTTATANDQVISEVTYTY